jgi:hypothetical protein
MHRKAPVGPMLVVVTDVAVEHPAEMAFVHDQETIGAFRAHRAHPALTDGIRQRCRLPLMGPLGPEPSG